MSGVGVSYRLTRRASARAANTCWAGGKTPAQLDASFIGPHCVRIVTLADGDVNKMLVAVKGLLGSMFLDDLAQKTKRARLAVSKPDAFPVAGASGTT